MTDKELNDIVCKARNATAGLWEAKGNLVYNINGAQIAYQATVISSDNKCTICEDQAYKNTEYIASVNPVVVIDLISELRKSRQERDFLIIQLKAVGINLESSLDDTIKSLVKLKSELQLNKIDWESMAEEYSNDR